MPEVSQQDDRFAAEMQQVSQWSERWAVPAVRAIYAGLLDQVEDELQRAHAALADCDLEPPVVEALNQYMKYLHYRWNWDEAVGAYSKASYEQAVGELSNHGNTEFGEAMRELTLFRIRIIGMLKGDDILEINECKVLMKRLPLCMRPIAAHQLASLGFEKSVVELLELALGELTVNPTNRLGQSTWQRANIMYQLVAGKATRRDVIETIRNLRIRPQLREFKEDIWPRCIKSGLIDPELEELLAQREAAVLADNEGPAYERKTKSFLGRI